MKSNMTKWHNVMTAGLVGQLAAMAAAQAAEPESTDSFVRGPNRVSVGAKFLFNVSADFQHFATPQNAGPGVGVAGLIEPVLLPAGLPLPVYFPGTVAKRHIPPEIKEIPFRGLSYLRGKESVNGRFFYRRGPASLCSPRGRNLFPIK